MIPLHRLIYFPPNFFVVSFKKPCGGTNGDGGGGELRELGMLLHYDE